MFVCTEQSALQWKLSITLFFSYSLFWCHYSDVLTVKVKSNTAIETLFLENHQIMVLGEILLMHIVHINVR